MKRYFIAALLLACACGVGAQTSRRAIEKVATEAVKQTTVTGRAPSGEIMNKLVQSADVSIEMLSRMGDPDDQAQCRACLKVIDAIAASTQTADGAPYVDLVRHGLKNATDRSDSPDTRRQLMQDLMLCAKSTDAPHFEMYLSDPDMAPTAFSALVALPGIDARIDSLVRVGAKPDTLLANIQKARAGKYVAAPKAATAVVKKTAAPPFWTTSLDAQIEKIAAHADASADSICSGTLSPDEAMPRLLALAARRDGEVRDGVLARYVNMAMRRSLADGERYLLLRLADELNPSADVRRKIIVGMGTTHCVQALAYIRQYFELPDYADAVAVAVRDIVAAAPNINGGRYVHNMLNAAKRAFVHHYDEQGADAAIDDVLNALDHCPVDGGYNLSSTSQTRMGKRGYWNMYDELADFDMAFDWNAAGPLTVSLHSVPVLTLDREQGARLAGSSSWMKVAKVDDWQTCNVMVSGNKLTLIVGGHVLATDADMKNPQDGQPVQAKGTIGFLADDNGATVRQVCIRKR